MALSNYPSGFRGGALIKNIPMFDTIDGNVFWVDSGSGGAGNPGTFNSPLSTMSGAIAKCTANNGDVIFYKSGHTEACASAGAIVNSVAGVTHVGLGNAGDMAQIRFTAAAADMDVTAASVRFINMRFTAAFADVTSAFDLTADGVQFHGCLFDEEIADENYVIVMEAADGVDNIVINDCDYIGNDIANDYLLNMLGTHNNVKITNNRMSHMTAQTAAAPFINSVTNQLNMLLAGNYMHSETAAIASGFVVLAGTANNGFAYDNLLSSVDTDATAANGVSAFDVTGLACKSNWFTSGVADTYALESFLTVEDLT